MLNRLMMGGLAATVLTLTGCGVEPRPLDPVPASRTAGAVTDHVLVVSIDGLRPDAIDRFGARNLQRLMREGSYSLLAQTIMPSKTLPSHTSMLTGTKPEVHGVTWNTFDSHAEVATPTVFAHARAAGFSTAGFFSKPKFRQLVQAGTMDHAEAPLGRKLMATETIGAAIEHLRHERPGLMFVHIAEPDYAGHVFGWMGRVYGWAVRQSDAGLGALLEQADRTYGPENYTVIVTSDHGGHGRDHGTDDPRDTTIPWIVAGEGVAPGQVTTAINTYDTTATALWLLGVRASSPIEGVPVIAAFTPAAGRLARASQARIPAETVLAR